LLLSLHVLLSLNLVLSHYLLVFHFLTDLDICYALSKFCGSVIELLRVVVIL